MKDGKKVVLVTGGAQGIGRTVVGLFVAEGWRAVVVDVDGEANRELQGVFSREEVLCVTGNVGKEAVIKGAVTRAVKAFGRLDGIVCNAGIGAGGSVEALSLAEWNRVLAVNLTSIFLLAKYGAGELRKTKGSIVTIASTRALQSEANTEAYSASKGGVVALTHALAASLAPDIRVNAISPGWIETGPWQKAKNRREAKHTDADRLQHPCGRVGTPEDIADIVAYLMSPSAGFITGQNFIVDGGMTTKMIYV